MEAARSGGAPPGATALSFRSWPAQKPRPAPVITSTRAGWSFRLASAARTSACISVLKLLRRSGRLRVSRAMPSAVPNRMFRQPTFFSAPRSFLVVIELERGSLHARLTREHLAGLQLPLLQPVVLRDLHVPANHLRA